MRYELIYYFSNLTPEIIHELIEKILVHAPNKSDGRCIQQMDIFYRFDVAVSNVSANMGKYGRKTA
ncbi:MAG: DUF4368 domain-containing protein [Oscillospiraceae bacterium]|nr:DUF4368 domain-containing protein [Oscillospiraceae bacterium]